MKRLWLGTLKRQIWILKRFPATLLIAALVLGVAFVTAGTSVANHRVLVDDVGLDLGKVLNWQLWTLPASTVIQPNLGIGVPLTGFMVVALASLEYLIGSWRAAVTFFFSDWISAPLTILVAWPIAHLGFDRAYVVLYRPDTGSSAAAVGALAAAMAFLPRRLRAIGYTALFTVLVCLLPTPGLSANIAHVLGALTGVAFGFLWRWRLPHRGWRSAHPHNFLRLIWPRTDQDPSRPHGPSISAPDTVHQPGHD